jgi:microcystin-dependent protein
VYINATNATNPATLFGFGTWVAFGAGRVPVGFDAGNTLFDTAEETGGSADAVVVSHTHSVTDPGHAHSLTASTGGGIFYGLITVAATTNAATNSATTGISIASAGVSGTNANIQPYITVYMWKRTA